MVVDLRVGWTRIDPHNTKGHEVYIDVCQSGCTKALLVQYGTIISFESEILITFSGILSLLEGWRWENAIVKLLPTSTPF